MKSFKAWVERVKSTVPPEKLLVFDVKEGWEPLCKFLNKPVPNEPFPNINDKKDLQQKMVQFLIFCYFLHFLRAAAILGGAGLVYWLVRHFMG